MRKLLLAWAGHVVRHRRCDFKVEAGPEVYLERWYLTPWRRWADQAERAPTRCNRAKAAVSALLPNVYLHHFRHDDDDRALHDHPWLWCSVMLHGTYVEHVIHAGGIQTRTRYTAPVIRFHRARFAYRISLIRARPCWTFFIVGPKFRTWGFHCPSRGWVPWYEFVDDANHGRVGRGCGEAF